MLRRNDKLLRYVFACSIIASLFPIACVSVDKTSSEKPYDFCFCGPAENAEGQAFCAIWGEGRDPQQAQKVWQSVQKDQCEPEHCSQYFSKYCKKMQMSGLKITGPRREPQTCFCDSVLMENDKGQVQMYCGAWAENDKYLIEYYSLDSCSPNRCQTAPFYKAAKICRNGFKAFYQASALAP